MSKQLQIANINPAETEMKKFLQKWIYPWRLETDYKPVARQFLLQVGAEANIVTYIIEGI